MQTIIVTPLAITRSDNTYGCVGSVTQSGQWIRPIPILASTLEQEHSIFKYFNWTQIQVDISHEPDARLEDRQLINTEKISDRIICDHDRLCLFDSILKNNVDDVFNDSVSLGLIRAQIKNLYIKRSTGRRLFIRCVFEDTSGENYDWIVPEIQLGKIVWPYVEKDESLNNDVLDSLLNRFSRTQVYLTLGLTTPNNRFPGRFRGCHPLVVGIHTIPDYRTLIGFKPFSS